MASARRQPSTTSLAKYARTTSPDTSARNLDFCNAFWGLGDGGVDVLFARMRGAARTMEELRGFWKERSLIEEDYAKRLAKLAKTPIGRDEIGELRNSIDTLRLETDKQAGYHSQLAQQFRTDLEGQVGAFVSKQQHHKKVYQVAIEKEFKLKQTREQHTSKAREKYESDCVRINSYTAQSTLVQGKDLDRIHQKLGRAQQTVQVNENDYAQFTRVLQETMQKWEQDWKGFCDTCQDLEEERMEFMKDNMWAYANAVSTVCVSDDESCEKMRLALEQLEPEKDMENFVRDYGTGNAIPEPPVFVNYANTDAPPVSSARVATRPANFARSTQRTSRTTAPLPDEERYDDTNHAGVGAGGIGGPSRTDGTALSRSATQRSTAPPPVQTNGVNTHVSPTRDTQRRQSTASVLIKQPVSAGDPIDPTVSNTQLVIGDRTWDVDSNKDPQQQKLAINAAARKSPEGEQDPLVKQMAQLNSAAIARRNTIRRETPPSTVQSRRGTVDSLTTPSPAPSTNAPPRDLRNSAEAVVGSYPLAQAPSRSASPNPPKVALMAPPPSAPPSTSNVPVEQIVSSYQRPFPGEPRSRANSSAGPPPVLNQHQPAPDQGIQRPTSRAGYPGVGTQSLVARPVSPARGPSPTTAMQTYNRGQPAPANVPAPAPPMSAPPSNGNLHRDMSVSRRPVTPNQVGIALGPDGRVIQDVMAPPVRQTTLHYTQPPSQPATQPYQAYHDTSRALTHAHQPQPPPQQPQQIQQAPPPRNDYAVVPNTYTNAQPYPYGHQPQHPTYNNGFHGHAGHGHGHEPVYAPHQVQQQPQPQPQQPPQQTNYNNYEQVTRQGYHHQPNQSVEHVAAATTRQPGYTGNVAVYPRSGRPGLQRSPSPAPPRGQAAPPTGTYTDDGRPILFYVKALYDYTATIDEEFDFQAGDIIAVTDTPEDGWWSGELLDDTRRQAGRHVFPSNFVCLF